MAETAPGNPMDDLDAFFSAAANADTDALHEAARNVAGGKPASKSESPTQTQSAKRTIKNTQIKPQKTTAKVDGGKPQEFQPLPKHLEGKFIAVDPSAPGIPKGRGTNDPFILIPAHIHAFLPWWGWLTIGLGLVVLMTAVLMLPGVTLDRLTARLSGGNHVSAQSAMAQLVIKGDERTVLQLYEMASSREEGMETRLRAVDTLSLIEMSDADRALLRLELANETDARIREAAIAARRQREAAKTRSRDR